jgi:hypothetical protein
MHRQQFNAVSSVNEEPMKLEILALSVHDRARVHHALPLAISEELLPLGPFHREVLPSDMACHDLLPLRYEAAILAPLPASFELAHDLFLNKFKKYY